MPKRYAHMAYPMKTRIPVSSDASAKVLFESDHTCCKCRVGGRKAQIHHIDDNLANNDPLNLAVLCLECHGETQTRGGFGRHLSEAEVREYRDDWTARVQNRRDEADRLAVAQMVSGMSPEVAGRAGNDRPTPAAEGRNSRLEIPNRTGFPDYASFLPELRRRAYQKMYQRNPVSTLDVVEAFMDLSAVLEQSIVTLLSYYPDKHFSDLGPKEYVASLAAESRHWHYMRASAYGVGDSGSIVQELTMSGLVGDLERRIEEIVSSLSGTDRRRASQEELAWQLAWRKNLPNEPDGA